MKTNYGKVLLSGIFKENPIFVLFLGLCPTLGVTSSAMNGLAMGLAVVAVLACSNFLISAFKNFIPSQVRIPAYIMIIASLVTIVQMVMEAYTPDLYKVLGLFIPLIVVNCIVLGRAESFASKNGMIASLLDGIGYPTSVAGVPPDYFSPTGQYWGNPIYDWQYLEKNDFRFWIERIGWASEIFDITRIDHFRAFDSYWDIPASAKTAMEGKWQYAPGYALFDKIYETLGDVELVAEDLGYLRPEVIELKDHYHLKGMKVFQFMLNDGYDNLENSFFYSGTGKNIF